MTDGSRALLCCTGGGIGDALVASIVGRALHTRFSVVDALAAPAHRDTLMRCRDLDDVAIDDGGEERDLAARLAQGDYAAAVVTWATPRVARALQAAAIPVRVGQASRLYSHRFTIRVPVRSESGDVTSAWADILLDYARALACTTTDLTPSFVPTKGDARESDALRERCDLSRDGYLILNPCNAIASQRRRWPTAGWARLARALAQRYDCPVVVSGSPREERIAAAIAAEAADQRVRSIAGQIGIGAFGDLAASARAFVGITTGSMHVAAAVGAPTVGIFPFQSDFPDRWAPRGRAIAVVRPSFRCHPGDTKERCADYACIEWLDVPRTLDALDRLID